MKENRMRISRSHTHKKAVHKEQVYKSNRHVFQAAVRILIGIAALLLLLWSLIPVALNIINAGVMASIPVSLAVLIGCIFWKPLSSFTRKLWKRKVWRVLMGILSAAVILMLGLFVVVSGLMLHSAARKPAKNATVIVLGAAIRGDQPSLMLSDRLNSAIRYLNENKGSVCIVSGGQGEDESYTEAQIMYTYMVNKGINPSRIYKEERSTSTDENIRYSMEIIQSKGLSRNVVIATQEFHEYRAQAMARHAGLAQISPCTCRSPWYLLECYWVREFAAICRYWLLGH